MSLKDAPGTIDPKPVDKIRAPVIQRVATSKRGMVSSAHYDATRAGSEILAAGGNAIDAAVATAFALGVCEPAASGLGGQTMMMIHLGEARRTIALDGSSRAPSRATIDALGHNPSGTGYRATTVPSTPATLSHALRQYGTMPLKDVLEPAIRLAEHGYRISPLQHRLTRREAKKLRAGTAAPFFLRDGLPIPKGERFRQPVLAETLRQLARKGIRDFYTGEIARSIEADMIRHDGLIRLDDLAQVPRPIERRALSCKLDSARVLTFPPPGAGRTLVEMVNTYQQFPAKLRNFDTPEGAVALAELIRKAFIDRNDRPFDPHRYAQITNKKMLSRDYAKAIARTIARSVKTHGETTHLSVMDDRGNVVALTQSIEKVYGSCSVTPELGFLYNNYMGAFDYTNMGHPYYLRPNAVPWASVAPTIVFHGRSPWAAIGSPGSERITPSLFQVLVRLAHNTPLGAVEAPRLFCSIDGQVSLEAERMSPEIPTALERQGLTVDRREGWAFYLGCVQLVLSEGGRFIGVADPRRDGEAAGP